MTSTTQLPPIYKTRQMFDVEQANDGRDIRLILIDLYNKLGSQAAVGRELGITQQTVDTWFDSLGIQVITKSEAILQAA